MSSLGLSSALTGDGCVKGVCTTALLPAGTGGAFGDDSFNGGSIMDDDEHYKVCVLFVCVFVHEYLVACTCTPPNMSCCLCACAY